MFRLAGQERQHRESMGTKVTVLCDSIRLRSVMICGKTYKDVQRRTKTYQDVPRRTKTRQAMRIRELSVQNFKSLRSVSLRPGNLSVFIGPNGAGKSNLCEALDFIGEMYRWGLELAVTRHGGYENICYRHTRRSKSPVALRIVTTIPGRESVLPARTVRAQDVPREVIIDHKISFRATNQRIKSPFSIVDESVKYSFRYAENSYEIPVLEVSRHNDEVTSIKRAENSNQLILPIFEGDGEVEIGRIFQGRVSSTESIIRLLERYTMPLVVSSRSMGLIDLYQLSPLTCRLSGVPTPNPQLGRDGNNLPGVIDSLKSRQPRAFQTILDTLRTIMPSLQDIDVVITPQRTLGLSFQEQGFGRPWTADDVSDGTIRALGLLAALFDRNTEVAVIEEPENSLHPWAIGQFVDACRVASRTKQIFLTTHSPTLINHLRPSDIWVVSKREAGSDVSRLTDLDPDAEIGWEAGQFTLAEYIDSGVIPSAVPVGQQ